VEKREVHSSIILMNTIILGDGFMSDKFDVFVYHHTHWDREWWATMQDFRIRLVELLDELLDVLDQEPEFRCFLLDGQTIVLKDYLEVRPENQERLLHYIHENRIQCGPWYILPDEFLVSGEAHIRNLWMGEKIAEKLGYKNLAIGYIPDTFGHISQMPQILQGFGIDNALIWRGIGGNSENFKQEFYWEAPNGSKVLAYWFPDGYYVVDFLHFDNPNKTYDETFGRVKRSLDRWAQRATTKSLLMPYGGDHRFIDKRLPRILKQVNKEFDQFEFHWSTTEEFIESVKKQNPVLNTIKGELREFGEEMPHVLPGVLSSRLHLKQRNFEGQNWLERYAEPFSTLAWNLGRKYDANLLWTSWELLIQNHPHDSICGCSIDQVHKEMIPRFDQSKQIAEIMTEKSIQYINKQIDTADITKDGNVLIIHNPLTWERREPVKIIVSQEELIHPRTHVIKDLNGSEVPFQVKEIGMTRPMTDKYWFTEICFIAEDVPALGYKSYVLEKRETPLDPKLKNFTAIQETANLKGNAAVTDLQLGNNQIENQFFKVEADPLKGTLIITDKETGLIYKGLNAFEDGGDAGDEYAYSGPLNDSLIRSDFSNEFIHISIAEVGHAKATLRVDINWKLPKGLAQDRLSRSGEYISTKISSFITLASMSKHIDIRTEFDNNVEDHRLRALFPLGSRVTISNAEGQFDVVERTVNVADKGNGWPEPYVSTMPQQGFVSVNDSLKGLTIINKGLPEYEVSSDDTGTIAITLVRAIGWLSREDTLVRVGGAGAETPTPDAQCLGKVIVEYSIVPHKGDYLEAKSYKLAHEYLSPLYGSVTDNHDGDLPKVRGFIQDCSEHTLLFSALKKAVKKNAMIMRFWNVSKEATTAVLKLNQNPARIYKVNLKEEEVQNGELEILADGRFEITANGSEIVTISIEF
jgi:mannosylglycerate hydrolase